MSAHAVFLAGGDVDAGMQVLTDGGLVPLLHDAHERGAVFFGMSAGSIMMGRSWVRWSDPADDRSAVLFPCLGIAPVTVDTHAEADDWEELRIAVRLMGPGGIGYGIPGGGTLVVMPDGQALSKGKPAVRCDDRGVCVMVPT